MHRILCTELSSLVCLWVSLGASGNLEVRDGRECARSAASASADSMLKPVKAAASPVADHKGHIGHVIGHAVQVGAV